MFHRLGLIGCGLMGGSLALAMRRAQLVREVVGFSTDTASLPLAQERGAIDQGVHSAGLAVREADCVVLAVPVAAMGSVMQAIAPSLRADALVIDLGSTKQNVIADAQAALGPRMGQFVPCHPIAGKEVAGIAHADPDLYRGRQVIITPARNTRIGPLQQATQLWEALDCRVLTMTPQAHDAAFAAVSHVPHLAAFALMHSILQQDDAADTLALGGSGFRDFTRIAAGDPAMWRDIFLCNKDEVLQQTTQLVAALRAFAQAIQADDAATLQTLIERASAARAAWQMTTRDDNARL